MCEAFIERKLLVCLVQILRTLSLKVVAVVVDVNFVALLTTRWKTRKLSAEQGRERLPLSCRPSTDYASCLYRIVMIIQLDESSEMLDL